MTVNECVLSLTGTPSIWYAGSGCGRLGEKYHVYEWLHIGLAAHKGILQSSLALFEINLRVELSYWQSLSKIAARVEASTTIQPKI